MFFCSVFTHLTQAFMKLPRLSPKRANKIVQVLIYALSASAGDTAN
jgi:hypothetical protein